MFDDRDKSIEEREEERLMRNINKKKNPTTQSSTQSTQSTQFTQPKTSPRQNNQQPPQQPTKVVNQPTKPPNKFVRPKKVYDNQPKGSGLTIRIKNSAQKAHIKEHQTFTAWANWVLKGSDITISNLTKDLADGTKLIILSQILLRKDLKYIKNPKLAFHRYENINIAVAALKEKVPSLTIANQDMFEKEKLPQILGFFYQLISNFSYGWGRDEKKDNKEKGQSITEIAYGWVEEIAKAYPGCKGLEPSKNGTKDFKTGELFKAIIHNALLGTGNEFRLQDYDNKSPQETINDMIDLAQKKLGIPKFFFTDDITEEAVPQERLIVPWLLAVKAEVYQTHLPNNERNASSPFAVMTESIQDSNRNSGRELSEQEQTPKLPTESAPSFTTTDLPMPEEEQLEEISNDSNSLNSGNNGENEEEQNKEGLNTTDDIQTSGNAFEKRYANENEQKEKCKGCHKQFSKDLIVIVNGDLYHEKCFSCNTCQATFTKFYWSWEGLPYCFDHYQDAAGLVCRKCTKKISDELVVVAVGSKWHSSCFSCKACNKHLTEKFYLFEDNIYCDDDYFKVAGDVCGGCFEPIKGQLIVEALKKKWHSQCFVCSDCHVRFLPDDENAPNVPFYNNNGKPYCNSCDGKLHGLKDMQTCAKCNKTITGSVLQAMKKTWHESCFVCSSCNEEFTESFVNISGLPYCNKCADKI